MDYNVENPTDISQDIFLLSKGHAVAALASVYGDVGYIDREALENSRGYGALIKGHPGPVIPGVPVATGPLGHSAWWETGSSRRAPAGREYSWVQTGIFPISALLWTKITARATIPESLW